MENCVNRRQFIARAGAGLAGAALLPRPALGVGRQKKREIKKAIMYATIGYKGSVLEKFKAVRAAGFEGVEPMSDMNQDEVLRAFDATGLKPASVCCNTHWGKPLSH